MISLKDIENAYTDHSKEIFSYIIRSVHDHDTAEDILQDVFTRLINYSLKKELSGENIRALLYTIARSICIDHARKMSRVVFEQNDIQALPDRHKHEASDSSEEMIDAVNILIDKLGEPEKSIILLRRNGLTYSEIVLIMKISERTLKRKVKSVISDIRKNLRNEGFFISDDTRSGDESLDK